MRTKSYMDKNIVFFLVKVHKCIQTNDINSQIYPFLTGNPLLVNRTKCSSDFNRFISICDRAIALDISRGWGCVKTFIKIAGQGRHNTLNSGTTVQVLALSLRKPDRAGQSENLQIFTSSSFTYIY